MSCEQKSGVFLNISCQNTKAHRCANCKKQVCETHSHTIKTRLLCEDCYWENYLYLSEDLVRDNRTTNDVFVSPLPSSSSSYDATNTAPTGFDNGFGGGEFGGGGASGAWTEGDMQSLDDSGAENGGILGGDDTFFYS